MGNGLMLGGFQDIASGFFVGASQVPAAQANMMLAKVQSFVMLIVTVIGILAMWLLPVSFIANGIIAAFPILGGIVNKFGSNSGGGDSGSNGIIGYLGSNTGEFIVAMAFALNAGSGLWATECGWFAEGASVLVQKIANAQWMSSDTPASIAQFKGEVKIYSDKQCSMMYQSYLSKEANMKNSLTQYVSSQHPDNNDMNYVRQKTAYTAVVCRLEVLAEKLNSDNYASKSGISDPNYYKQHLSQDSATSDQSGAFNPNFIEPSMAQSFGVSLPSGSN